MDQALPRTSTRIETAARGGYVDWAAIIAGALIAAALSFVLMAFGTAAGLFSVSPWPDSGISARMAVWLGIIYVIAQQIGSFMAGGYVAGRMRARLSDATEDEVDFRDGLHGALVWALGVALGAALAFSAAGIAARTGASLVGPAAGAAAERGTATLVDTLLRPASTNPQPPGATPAPAAPPPQAAAAPGDRTQVRDELARIITSAVASGSLTPDNKTYAAQVIARQTGISQQEAEARIDKAMTAALDAADRARRATMLAALVTGLSVIISFASAWWAALRGGEHRDNAVAARFTFAPRRTRRGTTTTLP